MNDDRELRSLLELQQQIAELQAHDENVALFIVCALIAIPILYLLYAAHKQPFR